MSSKTVFKVEEVGDVASAEGAALSKYVNLSETFCLTYHEKF